MVTIVMSKGFDETDWNKTRNNNKKNSKLCGFDAVTGELILFEFEFNK